MKEDIAYKPVYSVLEDVYEKMLCAARESAGREIGGLLGGSERTIRTVQLDRGLDGRNACCYTPDTKMMNEVLAQWSAENRFSFYGIFHSHFGNSGTLSRGDISYIERIMRAMPESITELLFPIVSLPQEKVFPYAAVIRREPGREPAVQIIPCEFVIRKEQDGKAFGEGRTDHTNIL